LLNRRSHSLLTEADVSAYRHQDTTTRFESAIPRATSPHFWALDGGQGALHEGNQSEFVVLMKEVSMFSRSASLLLTVLLMALPAIAQSQLLIDPSQAPITLKGGWQQKVGVGGSAPHSGDVAVKIAKINPDGTFEGKLDFFSPGKWCKAMNEPIKEGRITGNSITVVANGGPKTTCGLLTLEFRRGQEKWLQGRVKSEAGSGAAMWLNAPK
jgi:hypothetical protein